jgi:hypothetical protein
MPREDEHLSINLLFHIRLLRHILHIIYKKASATSRICWNLRYEIGNRTQDV